MARPNAAMPTLFKRSDHGNYCFRRVVGNKRTTINTGTSDYSEAKKFLRSYLQGESATALAVHQKQHIHKVANAFAQAATGQALERTKLASAFVIWQEHTPSLLRNGKSYNRQLLTHFNRFLGWSKKHNINYVEDIDHSVAMRYNNYLIHEKFTVK